jgi:Pyruvate/2-oxoglutarate dehydrogenase complex, dehydrogenase (E1) component, eukaryotic type, beta subunit
MRRITFAQGLREALTEEMRRDGGVFLLGEDIGRYGGTFGVTEGLLSEFGPDRVRDTPITEAAIAGAAVGAAVAGMRPVAEIMFSDFLTISMDALVNQAAKLHYMFGTKVPLVVRTAGGSGTGAACQHSQSLEAWFCHVPGLKVVMPSTPYDAKGLLKAAIRDDNPVMFFETKRLYGAEGEVPEGEYMLPLGKADIKRAGKDITLICYGGMAPRCIEAAETLAKEGIDVEIVDPRTLIPLDTQAIVASAQKTGRVLIVHEACKTAGFGAEISAAIAESEAFARLKAPIRRLGGADAPVPFSPGLEANAVPTREGIENAARALLR